MKIPDYFELTEDHNDPADDDSTEEEPKPIPFGVLGIKFLCNLLQFAVLCGLVALILIILQIFGHR